MRRLRLWLMGVMATLATSQLAFAQEEQSNFIKDATFSRDQVRGRQTLHEFAECVVERDSKGAIRWLELPPQKARADIQRFVTDSAPCMPGFAMSLQLYHMRGGLFEALYLRQFGSAEPTAKLAFREFPPAETRAFSTCVAHKNPNEADAFLRAYPGTPTEPKQIAALMPAINACVAETHTPTPNLSMFRAAIAEVLYCSRVPNEAACKQ
jgi:hypothetical protein